MKCILPLNAIEAEAVLPPEQVLKVLHTHSYVYETSAEFTVLMVNDEEILAKACWVLDTLYLPLVIANVRSL